MLGYMSVGTNDFDKAAAFYDELFALLGGKRVFDDEAFVAWGNRPDGAAFSIAKPFDGNPATVGNGVMAAIAAPDKETVDKIYNKAIELGGTDEGAPGPRGAAGAGGFYAGYFRDLDGNKLNCFFMG